MRRVSRCLAILSLCSLGCRDRRAPSVQSAPPATSAGTIPTKPSTGHTQRTEIGGLVIEEFDLGPASTVDHSLEQERELERAGLLATWTRDERPALPLGYELDGLGLRYDAKVLVRNVTTLDWAAKSAGGRIAMLVRDDSGAASSWLVVDRRAKRWPMDRLPPIWMGDALAWVDVHFDPTDAPSPRSTISVVKEGNEIFRAQQTLGGGPSVFEFASWNGGWILETRDDVFVDGQSMRRTRGFDEVGAWQLVGSVPVVAYRKGSSFGIDVNGQSASSAYDRIHFHGCCDHAIMNPLSNPSSVRFRATRNEHAFVVVVRNP